jgi:predicted NAD/FAD-dependent oxidoreductase
MSNVIVVGAGLSGLLAAERLTHTGHRVTVLDKGRGVGGRLATRRIETPDGRVATFDHGAQFFTVRSERFADLVGTWIAADVVYEWCRGFGSDDGHPRYAVHGGMTRLAKHLAHTLDVRTSTLVFSIAEATAKDDHFPNHRWTVAIDDGTRLGADAVIITCPIPQSYSLTIEGGIGLPRDLVSSDYDRTIGLLAVLDGPSALTEPGGLQDPDGVFSWVADNALKGISDVPALTCHANARWSLDHWDDSPEDGRRQLLEHIQPYLGTSACIASDYKKWRFATPRQPWSDPFFAHESIVFAGDAFAGPKVEGAALSGLAAADHVLSIIA